MQLHGGQWNGGVSGREEVEQLLTATEGGGGGGGGAGGGSERAI